MKYNKEQLYNFALYLAIFTIFYNIVEGILAINFGSRDNSLTLFGFGLDSFIEVISGTGIVHMIIRIKNNPHSTRDSFEHTALRITGIAFYMLTIGLVISAIISIINRHQPETTIWGIFISIVSLLVMYLLVYLKMNVGRKLDSQPIIADAKCTMVCIYMSLILLISSAAYEIFGIGYIDAIGTLALAYYAYNEGKECFEKIQNNTNCAC